MAYKIEKGVPLVEGRGKGNRSRAANIYKTEFNKMEIGDSFLLRTKKEMMACRRASWTWKMINPEKKLTIRQVERGYRCWRLK